MGPVEATTGATVEPVLEAVDAGFEDVDVRELAGALLVLWMDDIQASRQTQMDRGALCPRPRRSLFEWYRPPI
jgi:hypothetical protein